MCHTNERGSPLCLDRVRSDRTSVFRKKVQTYRNNLVLAQNYHVVVNADSCVKRVALYGYDDTPIRPDNYKCAKFSCQSKAGSCFVSNNPFNDDGSNVTVALSNVCQKNETCFVSNLGVNDIYNNQGINGTCKSNVPTPIITTRFPGEECTNNADCFSNAQNNGTCTENKCVGKAENGNCTSTEECLVGLYCRKPTEANSTGTCVKQLGDGANCTSTWECANSHFCYSGKCTKFGSLKVGSDVSEATLGEFAKDDRKDLVCEFQSLSQNRSLCVRVDYRDDTLNRADDSGFTTCEYNSDCLYTDGYTNFTNKCGCGYNANGQGYCPISHKTRMKILI